MGVMWLDDESGDSADEPLGATEKKRDVKEWMDGRGSENHGATHLNMFVLIIFVLHCSFPFSTRIV